MSSLSPSRACSARLALYSAGTRCEVGTVEAGKLGDLVIWDAPDLDYICYRFGSNLAKKVIKRGRVM